MRVSRPLAGKNLIAYGGGDLASHLDLLAVTLCIPFEKRYHLDVYCWIPEAAYEERQTANRDLFRRWRAEGWLTVHPGQEINYDLFLSDLIGLKSQYQIREIAFDTWNVAMPAQQMRKAGFRVYGFRQGEKTMSPACKDFEAGVYGQRIKHHGNPILEWAVANVMMTKGKQGNYTPDKRKSTGKIDPLISSIMAYALALQSETKPKSAYSEGPRIYGRKKPEQETK
jgi:phage terminase large subunit-like protein